MAMLYHTQCELHSYILQPQDLLTFVFISISVSIRIFFSKMIKTSPIRAVHLVHLINYVTLSLLLRVHKAHSKHPESTFDLDKEIFLSI